MATPGTTPGATTCASCGAPFECGAVAGADDCWCVHVPLLPSEVLASLAEEFEGCLCPACLEAVARAGREDAADAG